MAATKRNITAEKVMVGYPFGVIDPKFHLSMLQLVHYDANTSRRLQGIHSWHCAVGTTNIADARNKIVQAFLDDPTKPDWLCFIDTDQEFAPNTLDALIESADPVERPIVSALIMANRPERARPIAPACVVLNENGLPIQPPMIPNERHWHVAAVGTGFIVIHRSVLEKVGKEFKGKTPFPWFEFSPWWREENGEKVLDVLGEDYTFCLRAAQVAEAPAIVDTTIEVGHVKSKTLSSVDFYAQLPRDQIEDRTFVVIPVKDQLKLTKSILRQLFEQGDYAEIIVLDNGSNPETKRWLASQNFATVLNAEGMGIHEMWNAGAVLATKRYPKVNIAFLNNDLRIGPNFLKGMRDVLRDDPVGYGAVCANYDGREGTGSVRLHGICADRYDGTGGLAGFAYMVRGELFQQGYRFPNECKWWFGDNDLTVMLDQSDLPYGMALDVEVEHLDGGGKTGKWDSPEMQERLAKDQAAWFAHLARLGIEVKSEPAA